MRWSSAHHARFAARQARKSSRSLGPVQRANDLHHQPHQSKPIEAKPSGTCARHGSKALRVWTPFSGRSIFHLEVTSVRVRECLMTRRCCTLVLRVVSGQKSGDIRALVFKLTRRSVRRSLAEWGWQCRNSGLSSGVVIRRILYAGQPSHCSQSEQWLENPP
ncbi:hypothetical protein VTK26DRAFT_560 [Humicola hyalothermophila]